MFGGEGGIRTHGSHKDYSGFRDRPVRPLRHLSDCSDIIPRFRTPNVLIASAARLSFDDFLTHSLPVVVVVWLVALLLLRYLIRRELGVIPAQR
jgi:hypothetical protein